MDFKIEGIEETVAMLETAPKNIVARGYLKALSAAGNVIADAVEVRTPRKLEDTGGNSLDLGELRESLMVDVQLDSGFRGGSVDVGFGKNGRVALWVEYGHRIVMHGVTSADRRNGYKGKLLLRVNPESFDSNVPAYPFMRPAFDASADAAIEAFSNSIQQTVAEEFPQTNVA